MNEMNGNKNNTRLMSFKQRNYIRQLSTYKIITKNCPGYAGYVHKFLQSDLKITVKQAGCIIDTLKNMIELEEAKDSNDNEIQPLIGCSSQRSSEEVGSWHRFGTRASAKNRGTPQSIENQWAVCDLNA